MSTLDPILTRILSGVADANMPFSDVQRLLVTLGFDERIRGDHRIFAKAGIGEIINLQPKGSKAKPYQVKQVRDLLLKYHMGGEHFE